MPDTGTVSEPTLNRRNFLKLSGLTTAGVVAGASVGAVAAMNDAEVKIASAIGKNQLSDTITLPSLEVIVFNRLAFGPRSGDLEAFRNLVH